MHASFGYLVPNFCQPHLEPAGTFRSQGRATRAQKRQESYLEYLSNCHIVPFQQSDL